MSGGPPSSAPPPVSAIQVVEVSARDGLQNDPARLSTEQKVELVSRCAAAGLRRAEIASFVNPRLVPQMADGEAVVSGVRREVPGPASWIGLVLNTRGFERRRPPASTRSTASWASPTSSPGRTRR